MELEEIQAVSRMVEFHHWLSFQLHICQNYLDQSHGSSPTSIVTEDIQRNRRSLWWVENNERRDRTQEPSQVGKNSSSRR